VKRLGHLGQAAGVARLVQAVDDGLGLVGNQDRQIRQALAPIAEKLAWLDRPIAEQLPVEVHGAFAERGRAENSLRHLGGKAVVVQGRPIRDIAGGNQLAGDEQRVRE